MTDDKPLLLTQQQTRVINDFVEANRRGFVFFKTLERFVPTGRKDVKFCNDDHDNLCDKFIAALRKAGVNLPDSERYDVNVMVKGVSKPLLSFYTDDIEDQTHIYMGHADIARVSNGSLTRKHSAKVNLETLYELCYEHGISDKKQSYHAI